MIETRPVSIDTTLEIPSERDPRLATGAGKQQQRLAQLSPDQRTALVLERYPQLRALPNCDWQRLSARATFSILYGESSRHFARVELATLAIALASAGITVMYAVEVDSCVRSILDQLQQRFGITTSHEITLEVWEAWGRDTDLMRTLTMRLRKYAAAVNHHLADYRERLSRAEQERIGHLLLPPLPKQFRYRFVPEAEQKAAAQRKRKAKTDVVSECATAILALMLARYPSMDRFVRWYRQQIEQIEAGHLSIPARLVYEDDQLDLPRQPGPGAVSIEELRWRTVPVHLELTIWRPYEFSHRRYANRIQVTAPGTRERLAAISAHADWKGRSRIGIQADPHAYFVEVHAADHMPWFMGPVTGWHEQLARGRQARAQANGGKSTGHAGVGTPGERLVGYLGHAFASERQRGLRPMQVGVFFEPEAMYRGVLFGTAIVTLMLTADARVHEILQISADRFVKPVRVKNPDGAPKRDPTTNRIVTDIIVEQRLLPKGRKRDDLRLQYDVSAARVHLQEITRMLKAAHDGQVPVVSYSNQHPKAEQLGAERFLFQWNGRHLSPNTANHLIRLVLDDVVLVDRSGERIDVTSHLLRHAAATVQRQQYGVPLEVLAEAMGHTPGADGQAPEATRYYSQMTEVQKAEIRHDAIVAIMDDASWLCGSSSLRKRQGGSTGSWKKPTSAHARFWNAMVVSTQLHSAIAATPACASAAPPAPSASAAPSWSVDPSTSIASSSCWTAT